MEVMQSHTRSTSFLFSGGKCRSEAVSNKKELISFGVKHGHHNNTSCICETRINIKLAYVLGPYKNSPKSNMGAAHKHSHGGLCFSPSVGTTGSLHSAHASPVKPRQGRREWQRSTVNDSSVQ